MVRLDPAERTEVNRERLLYDEVFLNEMAERHGRHPFDIKMALRTSATVYEIRTAMRYWFGGNNTHRCSDRIWKRCAAVEDGSFRPNGDDA